MWENVAHEVDEEGNLRARKRARYEMNVDLSTQSTQETSSEMEEFSLGVADETRYHDPKQGYSHQSSQSEEAVRAKRDEIRRAHRYLQEHADPGLIQVDPLPSTWLTETEDRFDPASAKGREEEMLIPGQPNLESLATVPQLGSEQTTSTRTIDLTGDGAASPRPITQQTESQHTDTLTLSISESAFDSADQGSVADGLQNPEQGQDILSRSRRARVAAYLAAREGTFSAWTDVSLVSAGDNHTEEEIEL